MNQFQMQIKLYIIFVLLFIAGCTSDKQEELNPAQTDCNTEGVTYSGKVLSVVQSNCYSCHGNGNSEGNVTLDSYANLKTYAENGTLSGVINHKTGFSPMPQGGKLSDCDIQVIEKWITDGSPNN
jgi:mono/diheme cytochrome c family protein